MIVEFEAFEVEAEGVVEGVEVQLPGRVEPLAIDPCQGGPGALEEGAAPLPVRGQGAWRRATSSPPRAFWRRSLW